MNLIEQLQKWQLELPEPSVPGGSYVSVNIRGHIAYVAIQFPIINGKLFYQGRLGVELSTDEGYKAMQICALNVLSQIHHKIGLDAIEGMNHMDAYYQCSDAWNDAPKVVNGASDLFIHTLGEKGTHSRAIFGVDKLYGNLCAGITCQFTLK